MEKTGLGDVIPRQLQTVIELECDYVDALNSVSISCVCDFSRSRTNKPMC